MKWMSTPSITVLHCWSAFSFASHLRQSYSAAQYRASSWIVASCTPCDRSATSSLLGKRVAVRRRRRSVIASSGIATRNGRIAPAPGEFVLVTDMDLLFPETLRALAADAG